MLLVPGLERLPASSTATDCRDRAGSSCIDADKLYLVIESVRLDTLHFKEGRGELPKHGSAHSHLSPSPRNIRHDDQPINSAVRLANGNDGELGYR